MIKIFGIISLCLIACLGLGQAPEPTLVVSPIAKQVAAGSKITVTLTVTFAEGFHGYQNPPAGEYEIPVTVKVDGKEIKVIKIAYPAGVDATIGGMDKPTKAYEGTVKFPVTIQLPTKPGTKEVKFRVSYQQCDATSCFPPAEVNKTVKINVVKKVG
jgi:DsbC/DsbD-like thiol-disulfide interchange protein